MQVSHSASVSTHMELHSTTAMSLAQHCASNDAPRSDVTHTAGKSIQTAGLVLVSHRGKSHEAAEVRQRASTSGVL